MPSRVRIKTAMGRPLDVGHPSNRFILVATFLAGLGTLGWRWSTGADDIWLWSFRIAAAVFLAWAIGREVDPDDTGSAGVATLIVVPFTILGPPSLAASVASLFAARIAVRTTGISPHVIDGIALTAGAAYLAARPEAWPALGSLILAVGTDRYAQPSGPDRTLWFATAMIVAATAAGFAFADPPGWSQPTVGEWVMLGVTAVGGFLAIVNTRRPQSTADYRSSSLSESRLRFGRGLVLLTLVIGVVYLGGPIMATLSPLWAAIVAVTVVRYYRRQQGKRSGRSARVPS